MNIPNQLDQLVKRLKENIEHDVAEIIESMESAKAEEKA